MSTITTVGQPVDWPQFWQKFKQYALWDLEWFDGSEWISVKDDLAVQLSYPEPNRCKIKLIFDASHAGNYRLTHAINKVVKEYFARIDKYQYELTYEDIQMTFDWSDCVEIPGLQFSHGVKDDMFWFRIRRDNVPLGAHVEIDPSLVGTSTSASGTSATLDSFQRKTFYANGRHWVFYSDGTNMVYRTSTDGVTWTNATTVRAAAYGDEFSIWFDGTYVHYAYVYETAIYYRRGTPTDGSITWSDEQTVSTTYDNAVLPFVSVDTSGYVWIGYRDHSEFYPWVIKSGNNDGTWGTTPVNFPYQLSEIQNYWFVSIIPLTAGKMLAVYAYDDDVVYARRWTGLAWDAETSTTSSCYYGFYHSAVAQGDDVHLTFLSTGYDILYVKYTYATNSFGAETILVADATEYSAPVISRDPSTNDLYVFAATKTTDTPSGWAANHIYYIKYTETWGSWVDWIEETEVLTYEDRLTCFYQAYGGYIGLVYMTKTASPYNVMFAFLTMAPPPPEAVMPWNIAPRVMMMGA